MTVWSLRIPQFLDATIGGVPPEEGWELSPAEMREYLETADDDFDQRAAYATEAGRDSVDDESMEDVILALGMNRQVETYERVARTVGKGLLRVLEAEPELLERDVMELLVVLRTKGGVRGVAPSPLQFAWGLEAARRALNA